MANKTNKKTTSEPKDKPIVNVEEEVVVAKKFAPSDLIECRSVTGGQLILVGPKTGFQYIWEDYNDIAHVEYQDLLSLQSRRSGFLIRPRFIIEDEDLVEQWNSMLKPIYDRITTKNIEDFFNLPLNKFKAQLKTVPEGFKETIKTKVVQMINNDELYDVRKAREIDEAWGTDFVAMFIK